MRVEKENDFSSFSKILNKLDAGSLGEHELRMIKQEHSYLEKLRQQRMKIEELKKKYNELEIQNSEVTEHHHYLENLLEEKDQVLNQLESKLNEERARRESVEKQLQKYIEQEKGKNKTRVRELENENQELRKILRQKELCLMSMEDEFAQNMKSLRENFAAEKKTIIMEFQEILAQNKSKANDSDIIQLKNLVSRQNKALKMQNDKYEEVCNRNDQLTDENQDLRQALDKKNAQIQACQERMRELTQQIQEMEEQFHQQTSSNKLKDQLEDIRRKMNDLQKGQIERIEFIVNEFE